MSHPTCIFKSLYEGHLTFICEASDLYFVELWFGKGECLDQWTRCGLKISNMLWSNNEVKQAQLTATGTFDLVQGVH